MTDETLATPQAMAESAIKIKEGKQHHHRANSTFLDARSFQVVFPSGTTNSMTT